MAVVDVPTSLVGEKARERTIKGDARCGKCALKETDKCQNVIQVENKNGRNQFAATKLELVKYSGP